MTTITLHKIPEKLSFGKTNIDFDIFLDKLIDYMQDIEDIKSLKHEIENDNGYRIDFDNYLKNVGFKIN